MVRPNLIDLNPVELKYYPFMINSNKCAEICAVSLPKVCVSKETKGINVKAFNIITNNNEIEAMTE